MSEPNTPQPTLASEIELPIRAVELKHLRTRDGKPVVVFVEGRDELWVKEQLGLPGDVPGEPKSSAEKDQHTRSLLNVAAPLIHQLTWLSGASGPIRPAFHCDESHAVPGSVPWAMVRLADKLAVVTTLLDLCGCGGAAEARFSGEDGEGSSHGVGAVAGGDRAEGLTT